MSRLIDADALIKVLGIAENCNYCQYQNGPLCDKHNSFVDACVAIFAQPTIDAVEVVRCGECKWYEKIKYDDGYCDGYCDKNGLSIWDKDWYCADGERREE